MTSRQKDQLLSPIAPRSLTDREPKIPHSRYVLRVINLINSLI